MLRHLGSFVTYCCCSSTEARAGKVEFINTHEKYQSTFLWTYWFTKRFGIWIIDGELRDGDNDSRPRNNDKRIRLSSSNYRLTFFSCPLLLPWLISPFHSNHFRICNRIRKGKTWMFFFILFFNARINTQQINSEIPEREKKRKINDRCKPFTVPTQIYVYMNMYLYVYELWLSNGKSFIEIECYWENFWHHWMMS